RTWALARIAHDQRRAGPTLSLLAEPSPEGWSGPVLLDAKKGICGWAVRALEDDESPVALVHIMRFGKPSRARLMARVIERGAQTPVPPAIARALLRRLLPVSWKPEEETNDCYLAAVGDEEPLTL